MSITKNPFEHHFRGGQDIKKSEPTPDVTLTPSKRAALPDKTSAPSKKTVTHSGGLPPTRKGKEKGDDVVTGRSAAGFQKASPFKPTRHEKVSNIDPPKKQQPIWDPKKLPVDPSAPRPNPNVNSSAASGSSPGHSSDAGSSSSLVVATTAQGQEIIVTSASSDDYTKRVENSIDAKSDMASEKMTGENYQEVYKAQEEIKARQQNVEKQMGSEDEIEKRMRQQQAAADIHKSHELMAKMASLQLKLVPNMEPGEAYRIHGEIEQLRVELAQLQRPG